MLFPSEGKIFMKFTFYFYKHLNCNLDGDWTSWSTFTSCSTSCGEGLQTRFRSCSEPPPLYGGSDCTGVDIESQSCNTLIVCPIGKHIEIMQLLVATEKVQMFLLPEVLLDIYNLVFRYLKKYNTRTVNLKWQRNYI